jgi:hypothetical protein
MELTNTILTNQGFKQGDWRTQWMKTAAVFYVANIGTQKLSILMIGGGIPERCWEALTCSSTGFV